MTHWTSGYVADIDYTHGYFREQSPALLSLVLLNRAIEGNGARAPRYLELGFGQGVSLAMHAAACEGEFWGTDFHPGHAAQARALVEAAGCPAQIFDQSFEEFAARDDLPEFDIISLHGIWSWISPANRDTIVALARRHLAPGGMLHISYNALPGAAPVAPLQHLLSLHARLASATGSDMTQRVDAALDFTRAVIVAGAHYFQRNPIVAERFGALASMDKAYLAHEYFNAHWQPMAFSEVHDLLERAKLRFAGSARLADHLDGLHLHPDSQALLAGISSPVLRETTRDLMINAQFRTDVFVRGPRTLTDRQRLAGYLDTRFMLSTPAADVPMRLTTIIGELVFDETIYRPLLAALADNGHAAKTLATLRAWPGLEAKSLESLIQALIVLNSEGHVHPAQAPEVVERVRRRCRALNDRLLRQSAFRNQAGVLASPVLGAGFPVGWIERLFLLALQGGMPVQQWPQFVCETMVSAGGRFHRDGKPVDDMEEGMAEVRALAERFSTERLPLLQALGIA